MGSSAMFNKYVTVALPFGCTAVDIKQFIDFHTLLWKNQPVGVRQHRTSKIVEVQAAESIARKAFDKYDHDKSVFLDMQELKLVLKDLGFDFDQADPTSVDIFCARQFARADTDNNGQISFTEFVNFKNQLIEALEVTE